jgi:uncharacterized membrane protein
MIWFEQGRNPLKEFLKTTIIGGTSFLLPAALVVFILSYALRLVKRVAAPISTSLHLDQLGDIAGIGAATVLSILVLVLISFAAGIAARTAIGGRISRWSETSLLGRLPHYQLIKSMAEGLAHIESASGLKPALVSIEDGWQIGYLLEQLENDWVAVFLPQAPTPMSGTVMYFPANRVRPLGITMVQAMSIVKAIGVGSGAALHGVNLTLPSADHRTTG